MSFVFNPLTGQLDRVKKTAIGGKVTTTIAASSSDVVDVFAFDDFISAKYFLAFENSVDGEQRSLELTVTKNNNDIRDSVSNRLGRQPRVQVNPVINGSNVELSVTNNESQTITVCFTRIKI